MKKISFVIFMLCLTITGAFAQEQINISRFQGQKITGIEAHGIFSITAKQGTTTGVSVNIPARLEKQLVLKLDPRENYISTSKGKSPPKIKETMTTIVSRQRLPLPALTTWS